MPTFQSAFRFVVAILATVALAAPARSEVQSVEGADDLVKNLTSKTAGPDEEMVSIDSDGNGKPDIYKFYQKGKVPTDPNKPDSGGPVLRKEVDLTGNGKVDVWTWYNADGTRLREAFDLDFDGKVDLVVFYEKGQVVRKQYYTGGHVRPDVFKYYERGKLVRVERDRRGTGKIDTWEYWDGDHIDRIGEDNDGDGNVDRWVKPPPAKKS